MKKSKIAIVGSGPAALMAASVLCGLTTEIHLFEQKKRAGSKLLVAGHGGFNLTHSREKMFEEYRNIPQESLKQMQKFSNQDFIQFLNENLGIETFKGTSNRIFPIKDLTPAHVVNCWTKHLIEKGVQFNYFSKIEKLLELEYDFTILALGGKSWSKTGSDGNWLTYFHKNEIAIEDFQSSNAGYCVEWSTLIERKEIKFVRIHSKSFSMKGDIMCDSNLIEGTPIYASNIAFRKKEDLFIDFKPENTQEEIFNKINKQRNSTTGLKALKLSSLSIKLIQSQTSKQEYSDPWKLAKIIKNFLLPIKSLNPLEEAISSHGGVKFEELTDSFELKKFPNVYCIGEMVDWDAPTGGYLIQGCVSQGYAAAKNIQDKLTH